MAVAAKNLHVGDNLHWVYHGDYAATYFDPVPSQSCVTIIAEASPQGVA